MYGIIAREETRINERGNKITEGFTMYEDYYPYHRILKGFQVFPTWQDAPYFCVWVNKEALSIACFSEGDFSFTECVSADSFNAEIQAMIDFYGKGRHSLVIHEDGSAAQYMEDYTRFFKQAKKTATVHIAVRGGVAYLESITGDDSVDIQVDIQDYD